jgi:hypothetical protein
MKKQRSPLDDLDLSDYTVDHKTGKLTKLRRPGGRKKPSPTAREAIAKVLRRKPA